MRKIGSLFLALAVAASVAALNNRVEYSDGTSYESATVQGIYNNILKNGGKDIKSLSFNSRNGNYVELKNSDGSPLIQSNEKVMFADFLTNPSVFEFINALTVSVKDDDTAIRIGQLESKVSYLNDLNDKLQSNPKMSGEINAALEAMRQELAAARAELAQTRQEVAGIGSQIQRFGYEGGALVDKLDTKIQGIADKQTPSSQFSADLAALNKKLDAIAAETGAIVYGIKGDVAKTSAQLDTVLAEAAALASRLEGGIPNAAGGNVPLSQFSADLAALNKKLDSIAYEGGVIAYGLRSDVSARLGDIKTDVAQATAKLNSLLDEGSGLKSEVALVNARLNTTLNEAAVLATRLEGSIRNLAQGQAATGQFARDLALLNRKLEAIAVEGGIAVTALQNEAAQTNARLATALTEGGALAYGIKSAVTMTNAQLGAIAVDTGTLIAGLKNDVALANEQLTQANTRLARAGNQLDTALTEGGAAVAGLQRMGRQIDTALTEGGAAVASLQNNLNTIAAEGGALAYGIKRDMALTNAQIGAIAYEGGKIVAGLKSEAEMANMRLARMIADTSVLAARLDRNLQSIAAGAPAPVLDMFLSDLGTLKRQLDFIASEGEAIASGLKGDVKQANTHLNTVLSEGGSLAARIEQSLKETGAIVVENNLLGFDVKSRVTEANARINAMSSELGSFAGRVETGIKELGGMTSVSGRMPSSGAFNVPHQSTVSSVPAPAPAPTPVVAPVPMDGVVVAPAPAPAPVEVSQPAPVVNQPVANSVAAAPVDTPVEVSQPAPVAAVNSGSPAAAAVPVSSAADIAGSGGDPVTSRLEREIALMNERLNILSMRQETVLNIIAGKLSVPSGGGYNSSYAVNSANNAQKYSIQVWGRNNNDRFLYNQGVIAMFRNEVFTDDQTHRTVETPGYVITVVPEGKRVLAPKSATLKFNKGNLTRDEVITTLNSRNFKFYVDPTKVEEMIDMLL